MTDHEYVYIAGPYSGGKWGTNVKNAIEAAETVYRMGYYPFVPHAVTALWSICHEKDGDEWLSLDVGWLDQCDCLVRLPGKSPGADREVEYAEEHGIAVYHGLDRFVEAHEHKEVVSAP